MEYHSAKDAGVGNIEGRPTRGIDPKIQEIDDVFEAKSVNEIAKDTGANESEDDLHVNSVQLQCFAVEEDGK